MCIPNTHSLEETFQLQFYTSIPATKIKLGVILAEHRRSILPREESQRHEENLPIHFSDWPGVAFYVKQRLSTTQPNNVLYMHQLENGKIQQTNRSSTASEHPSHVNY